MRVIGAERAAPEEARKMADRYTKVVLTVIAVALVWLCVWGMGPPTFGTPAQAQFASRAVDVNIAGVGGEKIVLAWGTSFGDPVSFVRGLPVEVRAVEGPVGGTELDRFLEGIRSPGAATMAEPVKNPNKATR